MTAEERVQIAGLQATLRDVERRVGGLEAGQAQMLEAITALRLAVQRADAAHYDTCPVQPRVSKMEACIEDIDVRLAVIERDRERLLGAIFALRWQVAAVGAIAAVAPWIVKLLTTAVR